MTQKIMVICFLILFPDSLLEFEVVALLGFLRLVGETTASSLNTASETVSILERCEL